MTNNETMFPGETRYLPIRVGIIGAGRMGRIRALSAQAHPHCKVVHIADVVASSAQALAAEIGCSAGSDWGSLLARSDVDAVVVATPHKYLSPITISALRAGKFVFCEKPMARRFDEAESVLRFLGVSVPNSQDVLTRPLNGIHHRVLVGYTLRHHPAIIHAKKLVTEGFIGEPMYVRGRYGHGGRSGYEREWRGSVELSGGGELLDQGVHLIDLSRWFLGEFRQVTGVLGDYFWAQKEVQNVHSIPVEDFKSNSESEYIKHPAVEDNAFMLLRTQTEKIAFLHASWTQWKNMFSFEIFGREGFIAAEGLGGNYGPERLITGVRQAAGELPQIEEISFSQFPDSNGATSTQGKDRRRSRKTNSRGYCLALRSYWDTEWSEFVDAVQSTRSQRENTPNLRSASAFDAWQNLQIVDAIYRSAQQNIVVDLEPELPSTSTGAWDRQGTPRDLQLGGHLPRINSPRTCMPDGFVKPHQ